MPSKSTAKRAALYVRVSTGEQSTEAQRHELAEIAERRGWKVVEVYEDAGLSGAKGRDKRPALDRMLDDAKRRPFDVVMVWALDRFGRSVTDLCNNVKALNEVGVDLYVDQQPIDTTTSAGKLLFHVTAAFAEFERDMIRERVRAGLDRAKRKGKVLGRPPVSRAAESKAREMLAMGASVRAVAKATKISVGMAHKIGKRAKAEEAGASAD